MSDIKLFKLGDASIEELSVQSIQIEKSMQDLIQRNLESLLGITMLASEYSTGPNHGGRIDTLGIDENGSPVIIEYKRAVSENVINQGLFYLDWLMDHKKDFQWIVLEKLGEDVAKKVEWSAPRLLCIAGDFTKYDGHAVKQINRNIELIKYRRFGHDLLMIELVHVSKSLKGSASAVAEDIIPQEVSLPVSEENAYHSQLIVTRLANSSKALRDLFEEVSSYLVGLGDDVQTKQLKYYIAHKRIKNFVCLEIFPKAKIVTCFVKLDPSSVSLEKGFSRDVTKIGHFGTGDLELVLRSTQDFEKAQPYFRKAYEAG